MRSDDLNLGSSATPAAKRPFPGIEGIRLVMTTSLTPASLKQHAIDLFPDCEAAEVFAVGFERTRAHI